MLVFPTSNYFALLHSDHVCRLENAPQLTAIPAAAHRPEEPFRWRRGLRSTATSRQPTKDSHQSRLRVKAFKEARPLLQTPTQSCVNVRPRKRWHEVGEKNWEKKILHCSNRTESQWAVCGGLWQLLTFFSLFLFRSTKGQGFLGTRSSLESLKNTLVGWKKRVNPPAESREVLLLWPRVTV